MIPVYSHEISVYTNEHIPQLFRVHKCLHQNHCSRPTPIAFLHSTLTPFLKPSPSPCISSRCHFPLAVSPRHTPDLPPQRHVSRLFAALTPSHQTPLHDTSSSSAKCLANTISIADLTCVVRLKLSEHRRCAPAIILTMTQITQITQDCFMCRVVACP
jgi:hypothetical protein